MEATQYIFHGKVFPILYTKAIPLSPNSSVGGDTMFLENNIFEMTLFFLQVKELSHMKIVWAQFIH